MDDSSPSGWPAKAKRIVSAAQVNAALDAQAARLAPSLPADGTLTVMALMTGGMYPATALARRLPQPLRMDYVHATRYRDRMQGGAIDWVHMPDGLFGHVLLIDDIFDEGHTMSAVRQRLLDNGASAVTTAVLALKRHDRGRPRSEVDDYALEVPDRYVFGCGMDLHGLWRQLDEIWAV
ncbi:hypoxanthine-guanine phosphoribosyltransferase [Wenzhouxiangella sp. AB-CW3]|uniref:phosphoribosyltransferase family protein n=1 Tax=Wenzhouxiangella sp. AB-CW3 TaxID=2771012 RepID=UPI00168B6728|nr:phosphoribosyltransferase family protein [Wenzhouxiangella sp. AB-CW3]QOC21265.1 hypoxanthine-guanine phosphoribosyltransferase [Wenzhouxiangella sp. AB-CW3]